MIELNTSGGQLPRRVMISNTITINSAAIYTILRAVIHRPTDLRADIDLLDAQILEIAAAQPALCSGLDVPNFFGLQAEQGRSVTAYMAQAMSLVRREPGVVVLAGGPELTNALTAIAQAFHACTPLVVISGSNTLQKRDRGFPQDMDQLQVVRPFTKWARSCHAVERIPEYIEAAFRHALRGRPGPTYVEIPYDVMESKLRSGDAVYPEKPALLRPAPDPALLQMLYEMLKNARKPIAIAGSGAFWSGADSELLTLVQKTRIPLFLNNAGLAMPFPPEEVLGRVQGADARTLLIVQDRAVHRAGVVVLGVLGGRAHVDDLVKFSELC